MEGMSRAWRFCKSFLLPLLLLSAGAQLFCTTPTAAAGDESSSSAEEKLNVDIYLESLCGDTIRFFNNQIKPNYESMKHCLNLIYIPFGKASYTRQGGKTRFECQHGPRECAGNKVMACALKELDGRQDDQTKMLLCMFAAKSPHLAGEECAKKLGFDWDNMKECIEKSEGDKLLMKHGDKTLSMRPKINFIPWITINGIRSKSAYKNFKDVICNRCPSGC